MCKPIDEVSQDAHNDRRRDELEQSDGMEDDARIGRRRSREAFVRHDL